MVTTIGSSIQDLTIFTDEGKVFKASTKNELKFLAFEYGAKIPITNHHLTFGGGGSNSAACFSMLGIKTAVITSIGDDEIGKSIIENFKKIKVDTRFIQVNKHAQSDFSCIIAHENHGRDHIIFSLKRASDCLQISKKQIALLKKTDFLYLAGLSKNWQQNLDAVFNRYSGYVAWNPGGKQIALGAKKLSPYLSKTAVLILNENEAAKLLKLPLKHTAHPRELANSLQKYGTRSVLVTCGRKGAWLKIDDEVYYQKIVKEKKTMDTTGVGDAFGSSFSAGFFVLKLSAQKSLKLAALNSASVIETIGAQNVLLPLDKLQLNDML